MGHGIDTLYFVRQWTAATTTTNTREQSQSELEFEYSAAKTDELVSATVVGGLELPQGEKSWVTAAAWAVALFDWTCPTHLSFMTLLRLLRRVTRHSCHSFALQL